VHNRAPSCSNYLAQPRSPSLTSARRVTCANPIHHLHTRSSPRPLPFPAPLLQEEEEVGAEEEAKDADFRPSARGARSKAKPRNGHRPRGRPPLRRLPAGRTPHRRSVAHSSLRRGRALLRCSINAILLRNLDKAILLGCIERKGT